MQRLKYSKDYTPVFICSESWVIGNSKVDNLPSLLVSIHRL